MWMEKDREDVLVNDYSCKRLSANEHPTMGTGSDYIKGI